MPINLTNRPIAITGASSGIGAATALACAAAGMPVALAARRLDRCEELAKQINASGGRAIAVQCDVVNPADCESLVARTIEAFGSIHAIYANAGYGIEGAIHQMPDAELRRIFEVNFFGTMNAIRPAIPHFIKQRSGHVLICSSCLAKISVPFYSAYCATKSAQCMVGRAMKIELRAHGVHVSTVHPIGTRTEFFGNVKSTDGGQPVLASTHDGPFTQSADFVARKTVAALRRPRSEVWTGFTGLLTRLGMAVCMALPGIENPVLTAIAVKRQRQNARP